MIITQKRRFYWHMTDSPNIKGCTVLLELEYDVIDRQFNCSIMTRQTPRDRWSPSRAATPYEKALAKEQLTAEQLAACTAASINPSIWEVAQKNAQRRIESGLHGLIGTPFTLEAVSEMSRLVARTQADFARDAEIEKAWKEWTGR